MTVTTTSGSGFGRLVSIDPATGAVVWEGEPAGVQQVEAAVAAARAAFPLWSAEPVEERIAVVRRFGAALEKRAAQLARDISRETGKPPWEAKAEVAAMIAKIEISITAQAERAGTREARLGFGRSVLRHRPHGVMAVLGPYNFPGHLPNGHIVPALLAGDTVVFKPSEETPLVGESLTRAWDEAKPPPGVLNLVQGARATGAALLAGRIDGLLFTGSAGSGAHFQRMFANRPDVILALELGGNNPLVAWDGDPDASASIIVQSAFVSAGQRCSCARRLILPEGPAGDAVLEATLALADRLIIGAWDETSEPFMGPLISNDAAGRALAQAARLVEFGGRWIRRLQPIEGRSAAFLQPGIIDVTGLPVPDAEIFAPLLQVIRVPDFDSAIDVANATQFGLAAGLISDVDDRWERYLARTRAGVVNRNRPTTGASSSMPFGGLGASGNHRPSAYYATDYCAYPVASFEADQVVDLRSEMPGVRA